VSVSSVAVAVLQAAFVVAVSPFVVGLMRKVRARLEGRIGAPISQPWRDLRKLSRKQRMVSEHTSWVFSVAPIVLAASSLTIAAIVPSLSTVTALTQVGDLFTVAYLLLLGTVFLALAGLDTATAFGGMGASRAMTIAAISEPTILVSIFALSVTAGSSNLGAIVTTTLDHPSSALSPESVLAFAALVVVVVAETGRIPVDNPATHLELTMIHEAMTLDVSGPDLAIVELSAHVRMVVLFGLLANLFVPWGIATNAAPGPIVIALVAVVAKIVCLGVAIAVAEVFLAKLRIFRVPELLAASFVLAFLAVTASFFLQAPT
jgi:formate hydrogenlyase subunit 4